VNITWDAPAYEINESCQERTLGIIGLLIVIQFTHRCAGSALGPEWDGAVVGLLDLVPDEVVYLQQTKIAGRERGER
jgi:hypothetical protein